MNTEEALKPVEKNQLSNLSRSQLIELLLGEQDLRIQAILKMKAQSDEFFELKDKYIRLKKLVFEPRSEKKPKEKSKGSEPKNPPKERSQKPSERYGNIEVEEFEVDQLPAPQCSCCNNSMVDSGLREVSEMLTVIPKKFLVHRQLLVKYRCQSCHGGLVTTPNPPRIKPGSSYSDDFIIDVALSKYCDLIPIERYCAMAARQGVSRLPQNSLIELTHYLAEFLKPVCEAIKQEVLASEVIMADETPHRMLESKKKNWYLWGFSSENASYFQIESSRSGDIAGDFLLESLCRFLVTDVYSGYGKAVRLANEQRVLSERPEIKSAYCNAHARRRFDEISGDEGEPFVELYGEIYALEAEAKDLDKESRLAARQSMKPLFEEIRKSAENLVTEYSEKSSQVRAAKYFLGNYSELTLCLENTDIPLDNNQQESLLRNPVIGRKTWYGNHSVLGAKTTAALFTLVESCKLNKVNPRDYFPKIVKNIHENKPIYTPSQYKNLIDSEQNIH